MLRPKLELADIFRRHGEAWRKANAGHLNLAQRRVMTAIEICRTAALGGHVDRCQDCAHTRIAFNSCRNRSCPKCQWSTATAWLAAREAELLPVPYWHLVFTLPHAIGAIAPEWLPSHSSLRVLCERTPRREARALSNLARCSLRSDRAQQR
jgi:Transposase zinc-binding domain